MAQQNVPTEIRSVFVATDFSDTAAMALERAVEIARAHEARMVLFHVTLDPAAAGSSLYVLPPDFHDRLREASMDRLDEIAQQVRSQGLEVKSELQIGPARPTLLAGMRKHRPDLAVLGTRGLSGFAHLLLGSVAAEVLRGASCPVLTVHPGDTQSLDTLETVVVPTDFSEDAELAIDSALGLLARRERPVRVVLLHVQHLMVPLTPLAGSVPVKPVALAEALDRIREALEPTAERVRGRGLEAEVVAREGDAPSVITEVASSSGAGLIAMGTRGRSGLKHLLLGSTAERVVQHASCPVLTVRRLES